MRDKIGWVSLMMGDLGLGTGEALRVVIPRLPEDDSLMSRE